MRDARIAIQNLKADFSQKSASKAFKCEMDVLRPLCFDYFIHTDCVLSNIWAPEKQKDVVLVRITPPPARSLH